MLFDPEGTARLTAVLKLMGILIVLLLLLAEALLTSSDVKLVPRSDVADGNLDYYCKNPMLLVLICFY